MNLLKSLIILLLTLLYKINTYILVYAQANKLHNLIC